VPGHNVIIVGDLKTPDSFSLDGARFYSVERQARLDFEITKYLPFNHYSRKMIGYILAIHEGAKAIVDTDDDNFPLVNWQFPSSSVSCKQLSEDRGFVNIYQYFSKEGIWPRGFPLNLVSRSYNVEFESSKHSPVSVGVWQSLVNGDPDVDAIYRLLYGREDFVFDNHEPICLNKGTLCPFNSQNTMFFSNSFPLLYIPATVTFRFCDILRSLVAQPILSTHGLCVGFTGPTAKQIRNDHNLYRDLADELPMYEFVTLIPTLVNDIVSEKWTMAENLRLAYETLCKSSIVKEAELSLLDAWLRDIE